MDEHPQEERDPNRYLNLELFGTLVFRAMLVLCLLPTLLSLVIGVVYFAHDSPGLIRHVLWHLPMILACVALLLPWKYLLKRRATCVLALVAAMLVAHQAFSSFRTFKALSAIGPVLFPAIAFAFVAGGVALALHLRWHSRWKPVPFAAAAGLVLIALVFGSGNPQWSRFIFVWQVYYSPFKMDAANLPTNRSEPRLTLPKYTEWDAWGRKSLEWTHPNGVLLRTEFYPDGKKRREISYAGDQVVTEWLPSGEMACRCDWKTGEKRCWKADGTPRGSGQDAGPAT